jgi:type II secretory pathway component GspD/PulD (secretin)
MTAQFIILFSAYQAALFSQAPSGVANPMPVLQGTIGSGKASSGVRMVNTGFQPLNPAALPGVRLLAPQLAQPASPPPAPKEGSQGSNNAFDSVIGKLFAAPAPKASGQTPEGTKTAPAAAQPAAEPRPLPTGSTVQNLNPSSPSLAILLPNPASARIGKSEAGQVQTGDPAAVVPPAFRPSAVVITPAKEPIPPLNQADRAEAARSLLPPIPTTTRASVPAPHKASQPVAVAAAAADPGEKTISLDVVDMELSKVLQALSDQSGTNLVLMSPAQKSLTIRLNRIPLQEALSHICAVSGLKMLRINRTYVIAGPEDLERAYPREYRDAYPKEEVKPEAATDPEPEKEVEVITLSYTTAREVVNVIRKSFDEKTLRAQVGPSQHIPSLANADTQQVTGVSTGILRDDNGQGGSGGQENSSPGSRILVLHGTKEAIQSARAIAKQLDSPRPQVSIAVKIVDIANDAMKELGLSWTFGDVAINEDEGKGINFRSFTRDPQAFLAKLSALQKNDRAKIMAQPNISVLDNQRAFILIGQRLNFPTLVGYTQANTPIFAPKEERVGIYMQVAASVAPNGEITMSLYPQVSTVTSFLEVNGASYPQISTREAQTTLRVKSGESIVLGGLVRDEEIKNVQKVPFLADLPILGEFFRRTRNQKTSSQIIITITPIVTFPAGHAS